MILSSKVVSFCCEGLDVMGQARYFRRGGFGCKSGRVCRLPLFGFFGRLGVFAFYCLSV